MSKTSRQLIIFHIFLSSIVIEWEDINSLIEVSHKTILRDIQVLKKAGLINVIYSREEKGYIHIDEKSHCPFLLPIFEDNKKENMQIDKLIRMATIMVGLRGHTEEPFYYDLAKNQETCSSWYKKQFPEKSPRTMQRDFKQLNEIGYYISYNREERYYIVDFPDYLEGIVIDLKEDNSYDK